MSGVKGVGIVCRCVRKWCGCWKFVSVVDVGVGGAAFEIARAALCDV